VIKFIKTESKINSSEIKEVENLIGLSFPNQYTNHLLRYNGGKCKPDIFTFEEDGGIARSRIQLFFAIHDGKNNLVNNINIYKIDEKRLPIHILPIADDPFGNLICISCGEKDYGFIYFWNHENEVDYAESDAYDYSNLYLITKNFDDFINTLTSE
jgi:SMI1-KNR4 cell-wall